MRRITVEEVKMAYEAIDYKPQDRIWLDMDNKCCCALSAVALKENRADEQTLHNQCGYKDMANLLELDDKYVKGFVYGFDNEDFEDDEYEPTVEELFGMKDGQKVRKAILESQ
jgi:hypothetical protein